MPGLIGRASNTPIAGSTGVFQLKSGRISAPLLPQAWQMNLDPRSDMLACRYEAPRHLS